MLLRTKMLLAFGGLGLVAIGMTGWIASVHARDSLEAATYERLTALRESKKRQIETYFEGVRRNILSFARCGEAVVATDRLVQAYRDWSVTGPDRTERIADLRSSVRGYYESQFIPRLVQPGDEPLAPDSFMPADDRSLLLQHYYIAANEHPTGEKDELIDAGDGSAYSEAHRLFHPAFRDFQRTYGFYDVFVIDAESGHVAYSVFKEVDVGTDLLTGPHRLSSLAAVYRAAVDAAAPGTVQMADFQVYAPSYFAPASFMATPIFEGGRMIAVLAFQVPIDHINDVMTGSRNWRTDGLGESGETYLVGPDMLMRSDSRFIIEAPQRLAEQQRDSGTDERTIELMRMHETTVLFQEVRTEAAVDALAGKSDTRIILDYRGIPVLSSYTPLDIRDVRWALLSEIDVAEAFAGAAALRRRVIGLAVIVGLIFAAAGMVFARTITRPVAHLTREAQALGHGDLSRRVPVESNDEIGVLAATFNEMAATLERTTVSKEYVEGVLDSMMNPMLVVSTGGHGTAEDVAAGSIETVNPAACRLLGVEATDLVGRPVSEIVRPAAGGADWWEVVQRDGSVSETEKHFAAADGRQIPVLFTASQLRDGRGRARGVVCVALDLTERKRLESTLAEKGLMERNLEIARAIQRGLLPSRSPMLHGFEIAGWSEAADETGGDYYDWMPLPDGRIVVTLADVTGHGIGPAIVSSVCRAYARATLTGDDGLEQLLMRLNELLIVDLPADRFITFVAAVLNPQSSTIEVLSAGHGPLVYFRSADGSTEAWDAHGVPLAIMSDIEFEKPLPIEFGVGDLLALVSDGFFEWANADGELFGTDRMLECVRSNATRPAHEIIEALREEVYAFAAGTPQADDMTAVIVRRLTEPAGAGGAGGAGGAAGAGDDGVGTGSERISE